MFYTFLSVNTVCVSKVCTGFIDVTVYVEQVFKVLRHMESICIHTRYHGDHCNGDGTMCFFCCLKVKQILLNAVTSQRIIFLRAPFMIKALTSILWPISISKWSLALFPPMWN